MTPCQRHKKQLQSYLDNELAAIEKKEFETHLDGCVECGDHVRRLKRLRQSLKSLTPVPCDSNFEILLRERIRREMAGKIKRRPVIIPAIRWSFAAVAVLAISLGSIKLFNASSKSGANAMMAQESAGAQSEIPPGLTNSSDQIQYVMDNFPENPNEDVIAGRSENDGRAGDEFSDSTGMVQHYDEIKNNIRTVSF